MTDSILGGLLFSGSYTVDVLESAGVRATQLRKLVKASLMEDFYWGEFDESTVDYLMQGSPTLTAAISLARARDAVLETAHLLTASMRPEAGEPLTEDIFPKRQRRDKPAELPLQHSLEERVCELLSYVVWYVVENPGDMLRTRSHPITQQEDADLDVGLGHSHPDMQVDELEFIISALNAWFVQRAILTDPPALCLRTIDRCSPLLYAPAMFSEAGGNLKALDVGLELTRKFSPERDLAGLTLFHRDGRIFVGQYTYRNTFLIDTHVGHGFPVRRVTVEAVRPASLVPTWVIDDFQAVLSRRHLQEREIQAFLVAHPEILQALGYASVRPHLCLRPETGEPLIPDFVLEIPGTRGFDILDLKLPTARLVVETPYVRMSCELVKAIAQLRKYAKFFDRPENRKVFHRVYGLQPFRPELTVVIGRERGVNSQDVRLEIEEQLGNIRLLTYDDLIAYASSRSLLIPR